MNLNQQLDIFFEHLVQVYSSWLVAEPRPNAEAENCSNTCTRQSRRHYSWRSQMVKTYRSDLIILPDTVVSVVDIYNPKLSIRWIKSLNLAPEQAVHNLQIHQIQESQALESSTLTYPLQIALIKAHTSLLREKKSW